MLKKAIAVTFGGQIARVALATVGSALLARGLGPDGRGLYALAVLIPRTIQMVARFGQVEVNSTFAGLHRDQRKALFAQTVLFGLVLGALSMIAVAAYFFWLPVERGQFADLTVGVMMLALFLAPVEMVANLLRELARGAERIASTVAITTVGAALTSLAILVCITWLDLGLAAAMGITLAVPIVLIVCHVVQVRDFATLNLRHLSWTLLKESFRFGGTICLSSVAMFLIYRVSIYLLGYMEIQMADIGLFAVALMAADQIKIIPSSVAQAFLPTMSNDPEARMGQTPLVFRYTLIASLGAGVALAAIAPPAMLILFGREFSGSILPFLGLLPGLAVFGGARVLGMYLWVRKKPQYGLIINWITLIFIAGVSILLIPRLGILGASFGNSLGLFLLSGLCALAYRRESGVPLRDLVPRREDFTAMVRHGMDLLGKLWPKRKSAGTL